MWRSGRPKLTAKTLAAHRQNGVSGRRNEFCDEWFDKKALLLPFSVDEFAGFGAIVGETNLMFLTLAIPWPFMRLSLSRFESL